MIGGKLALRLERVIEAPIGAVFDAWLDPRSLEQWMRPGPGVAVPEATTDPVVGGRYRIVMSDRGRLLPHEGEYLVIERPTRLSFTWNSEPAGATVVSLELEALAAHRTRLVLVQERLATAPAVEAHRRGWDRILETLERILTGRASHQASGPMPPPASRRNQPSEEP